MQKILDVALVHAEAAEVYRKTSSSTPVEFSNNKLKSIDTSFSEGVALRVMKEGRVGFSSTTKQHDASTLVSNALATAQFGADAVFEFAPTAEFANVRNFDSGVVQIGVEQMVDVGRQIVESVSALDPNVMVSVSIEKACDKCEIANSRGLWVSHESTSYSVSVSAEIVEGENFLQVYDVASSASAGIPVDDMVSRIKQKIVSGRKNAKISSGKYPVLFTPLALADILRPILACANGTAVHKGFSPFKDKLGERLFAASFDLYCDSVRDGSPSSTPFDAEGVAARRLPIVKEGILEQFMLDLRTASLLRRAATGSAVRHSVDSAPDIGVVGLELSPGDGALDKMVAQIRKGLIVDLLMGAWSGNPFGGVVNGNVMLGFVVEDGEVVGRCKDVMLSCNVFEALREQIIAISKEREDRGETLFPHVLLDGLGVAARA